MARCDADLKEPELKRQQKLVASIDDIVRATTIAAEVLIRDLDRIPSFADDFASAFHRGGVLKSRKALKDKSDEIRRAMVKGLQGVADGEAAADAVDLY